MDTIDDILSDQNQQILRIGDEMIIIDIEVPENYGVGACENCKQIKPIRPIQAIGWIAKESRGWFGLCFSCEGPHIFWKYSEHGRTYRSPVRAVA